MKTEQLIINAIPNPIIITNGEKMLLCNKNLLEFFNLNSIDDFLEEHKCICELFQDKDDCFSLSIINDDVLWVDYIYKKNEVIKVSILNYKQEENIFNLIVETVNENYIVVLTNQTAKEENKELKELAYHDHLTQIYNRQMFDKLYIKELENKKRHGDTLSLIMLDIDHFKELNDTYGHDVGDKVLIALSKLITANLRANDIFARWGGEEFLILLPRTNVDIAYKKAEQLRSIIDKYKDKIPHFTVSFGVTEVLDYDKELSAFIRVDKALYKAKVNRNDVVQL